MSKLECYDDNRWWGFYFGENNWIGGDESTERVALVKRLVPSQGSKIVGMINAKHIYIFHNLINNKLTDTKMTNLIFKLIEHNTRKLSNACPR